MNYKSFLTYLLLVFLLLAMSSCSYTDQTGSQSMLSESPSSDETVPSSPAASQTTTPSVELSQGKILPPISVASGVSVIDPVTMPPVQGRFDFTPLPKTGENVELLFNIDILNTDINYLWAGTWHKETPATLTNSKVWIEVEKAGIKGSYSEARKFSRIPLNEVVVDGQTSWEGNALENKSIKLKSTIRLPGDGIWLFRGYFAGSNWNLSFRYSRYIAVADGFSVDCFSLFPDDDLKSTPLAYLANFDYGKELLRNQLPITEQNPLSLEIDIAHPPLAGEEMTLIYRAGSPFRDIDDVAINTNFTKRTAYDQIIDIAATDIVVNSELGWDTNVFDKKIWPEWMLNLKKNETRELLTTIRFPEYGEWTIHIQGEGQLPYGKYAWANDDLKLTIQENIAYYGWEKRQN